MIDTIANTHELQWIRYKGQQPNLHPQKPDHPSMLRSIPIRLDPSDRVNPEEPPISDLLYAGFLEHLGRCIYGGVVDDYRDPSPLEILEVQETQGQELTRGRLGWRKDVMGLLAKDGDLEIPMMRWPGGKCLCAHL